MLAFLSFQGIHPLRKPSNTITYRLGPICNAQDTGVRQSKLMMSVFVYQRDRQNLRCRNVSCSGLRCTEEGLGGARTVAHGICVQVGVQFLASHSAEGHLFAFTFRSGATAVMASLSIGDVVSVCRQMQMQPGALGMRMSKGSSSLCIVA